MIRYENGDFEAHGDTAGILSDLTNAIRGVRYALEANTEMPESVIKDVLFEAYRLGSMKDEELEELARAEDLDLSPVKAEEVIQR